MKRLALVIFALVFCVTGTQAADSNFRAMFWPVLLKQVPELLSAQNKTTGRWGKGPIVITEQNAIYPLAVAWAKSYPGNKYYHDPRVLKAILLGGDFLISQQEPDGQWVFRTKDGGEWGNIYMPWTYSRWIRTYGLIRDAMPADEKSRWENALVLGFDGIAKNKLHGDLHFIENIPTHHAMGLYLAGQLLHRPDWVKKAVAYLHQAIKAQDPGGFWTENLGPVVNYNFVYMDSLGIYYAASHDPAVLPCLQRGAAFHANFTYPDGTRVETIDERNAYDTDIDVPNAGFSFSPLGRALIVQQAHLKQAHQAIGADLAATFILYSEDGPMTNTLTSTDHQFILGHDDAMVLRQKPWFICLSAYHAPVPSDRWIQDRQNFVSIYHDGEGLLIGGGNTKLTPLWSTFTAGDIQKLPSQAGTTQPSYAEPAGLLHVPDDLKLFPNELSLIGDYGGAKCKVQVQLKDGHTALLTYSLLNSSKLPVAAHVTLLPKADATWRCKNSDGMLHLFCDEHETANDNMKQHHAWSIAAPAGATLDWPVLPYDQYVKNGTAPLSQGRIVLSIPLGMTPKVATVTLTAGD